MAEGRGMHEQRAFSPEEVAIMLGVSHSTVSSLLRKGALGSREIGDFRRIFLSDLEDYLGEERARSLVRDINSGEADVRSNTSGRSTPESSAADHENSDIEFEVEARDSGDYGRKYRASRYEPVVQKWSKIDEGNEAIVLTDLSKNDVQNIKNILYRRVGKEHVIVRAAEQGDGTFKAVVRAREGGDKYLRD